MCAACVQIHSTQALIQEAQQRVNAELARYGSNLATLAALVSRAQNGLKEVSGSQRARACAVAAWWHVAGRV